MATLTTMDFVENKTRLWNERGSAYRKEAKRDSGGRKRKVASARITRGNEENGGRTRKRSRRSVVEQDTDPNSAQEGAARFLEAQISPSITEVERVAFRKYVEKGGCNLEKRRWKELGVGYNCLRRGLAAKCGPADGGRLACLPCRGRRAAGEAPCSQTGAFEVWRMCSWLQDYLGVDPERLYEFVADSTYTYHSFAGPRSASDLATGKSILDRDNVGLFFGWSGIHSPGDPTGFGQLDVDGGGAEEQEAMNGEGDGRDIDAGERVPDKCGMKNGTNGEQKKGGEEVQDEEDSERTAEIDNCSDGEVGESNGYNENILKVDGALTTGREDGSDGEEGGRRSTGQEEPMFSANAKASTGEHNEIVRRPGLEESDSEEDEDEASLGLTWRHAAQSVEYMCTEGGWTRRRSLGEARGGGRKRVYNDTGNNHTSDLPVKLRKVEAEATRAGSADSNVRGIAIYEGDRRRIEEDKATWKERVQGGRPLRDVGGEEAETMLMGGPGLIKGGRRSWPNGADHAKQNREKGSAEIDGERKEEKVAIYWRFSRT
ncbi:hypothetical protein PLICRDRAFT_33132 [Plicaturopsis crispa FD-325 SS-3]|uniref:Uncharacterized protein n=1 Tax=Plicaturopsis crispa FD-325 SS-3 TaxID=944288 RepID=A0A0C9SVF6_PLICR|nr:hypothetical protein PLICRDRAFT_33132 [Plicaturopsis crispa FD-325 SS-3]